MGVKNLVRETREPRTDWSLSSKNNWETKQNLKEIGIISNGTTLKWYFFHKKREVISENKKEALHGILPNLRLFASSAPQLVSACKILFSFL